MTGEKDPNAESQTIATIEEPSLAPLENSVEIKPEPGDPVVGAFPTVGIGASAGGLAALEQFFAAMPPDTDPGMAFVLVQHLSPDHKSLLAELVRRCTRMQVYEVEDGMTVQPNCAYIIPPNHDMALSQGKLHLLEMGERHGLRLPIDFFFRSLAHDLREQAICIVLSGTGSDGTLGLRAIKEAGGMAMAQTPDSTEFDGMPRSAITTGLVDYVLLPAEMPAQLIAYVAHAYGKNPRPASLPRSTEDGLSKIFILLRAQTGRDFSQYKQNTITRRIERRMAVQQIAQIDEYVRYLQQNAVEIEALFQDLLIGVTQFFRDPEAFAVLESQAIARLLADKPAGALVRIWVPGCSTGEEAYSIAILIREQMVTLKQSFKVQIFATDIDSRAITTARAGIYPTSIAADVSPERLSRFFVHDPTNSVYRIQKSIRDMLIFSEHDLIQAPPFSRLDLISCRNLLIYMGGGLQKKLIPLFHYALNPGGLLFLGSSESVGEFIQLFATLDRKWKLYQRQEEASGASYPRLDHLTPSSTITRTARRPLTRAATEGKPPMRKLTEQTLLDEYTPAAVLVNAQGDIFYIHGRTGRYLEPVPGEAGISNILTMAREGLRRPLTSALHQAATNHVPVSHPGLRVKTNGGFTAVDLTLRPTAAAGSSEPKLYLVILKEVKEHDGKTAVAPNPDETHLTDDSDSRIAALEQELQAKEEYLQTAVEEMETANEELKSTNEELQSVNEELQSTNEELETSKEELQSVNEELSTVNTELQQRVTELSRANNDMNNLLAGTGVGTIFVDHQLRIQRFTPTVTQIIHLIPTDIGRPVGHITANLAGYDRLTADVQAVLDNLAPKEIEVQTPTGDWYMLGIRPYRTLENVIEGAVITFVDITRIKKAEALQRLAVVVRDASDAITLQDLQDNILAWNPAAERLYGWRETEALALNNRDRIPPDLHAQEIEAIQQLSQAAVLKPYHTRRLCKDGRIVDVYLTATALIDEAGEVYAIATTERQIGQT
ncbi:MAG: PAS domain-containing protein [Anaerolinea sp.]|nr:PAS domain-containing protein [Anaerolinea sp.]